MGPRQIVFPLLLAGFLGGLPEPLHAQREGAGRSVDILGLTLGMTPDEVRQTILKHNPAMTVRTYEERLPAPLDSAPFLAGVLATTNPTARDVATELIHVQFTNPTATGGAIGIVKMNYYPVGQEVALEPLLAALKAKFGNPIHVSPGSNGMYLGWAFGPGSERWDAYTRQVCAEAALAQANFLHYTSQAGQRHPAMKTEVIAPCGVVMGVRIGTHSAGAGGGDPVVAQITVGLADMNRLSDAGQEIMELRRGTHPASRAAAEKKQREAEARGQPRF